MRDADAQPGPPSRWSVAWAAIPPLALVLALLAFQVVGTTFAGQDQPDRRALDVYAYVLLCAGPLALLALRKQPKLVLAGVLTVTLTYLLVGYPFGPVFVSMLVAIIAASVRGERAAAIVATLLLYLGQYATPVLLDLEEAPSAAQAAGAAAWLLVVLLVAEGIRFRRAQLAEAARSREEEARRRASEDRLRVARELHDVLAHSISLINVQASTALHLIDERPEQARDALAAIKQASKEALGEVRSVLGVLREAGEEAPRSPAAGLGRLEDLVASRSAAGLKVRTRTLGTPRPLPEGVDAAAFRIVQEALTNVTRHAGDATATIAVTYGDAELTICVEDDGRGSTSGSAGGNGLGGMRERAEALGGRLEAGPKASGGFQVLARLPTGVKRSGDRDAGVTA